MIIHTNAVVLHRMKYKNSGLIARIFTKDYGKVSIIVNGASKQKGNMFGVIEPPNIIKLNYYQKNTGGLQICKEATFLHSNLNIKKDILKLGVSFVIVETIDKTLYENDIHISIYNLTDTVLHILNNTDKNPTLILTYFLLHIIIYLGFMPEINNNETTMIIDQKTKTILQQLKQCSYEEFMKINIENEKLMDIIVFLENYITENLRLTQKINSLKMIKDVIYE